MGVFTDDRFFIGHPGESEKLTILAGGNVGIGTFSPTWKLQIDGTGDNYLGVKSSDVANKRRVLLGTNNGGTAAYVELAQDPVQASKRWQIGVLTDDRFYIGHPGEVDKLTLVTGGNVGIGTIAPAAKLHVVGNVIVDGNIGAKYQDVAEWVESDEMLEPGTVVVIDESADNTVAAAAQSYDSRIAGAVSSQPGVLLGEAGPGRIMIAQSGRVRIKADASYGAIRRGDLLVSSPTRGHAMRSRPLRIAGATVHRPGTVLGKALEPLANGRGEILALLTLQ